MFIFRMVKHDAERYSVKHYSASINTDRQGNVVLFVYVSIFKLTIFKMG